jgi:transposase-like protein
LAKHVNRLPMISTSGLELNNGEIMRFKLDVQSTKQIAESFVEYLKFCLSVLTELPNRGVRDISIACVDSLKGFTETIESVSPQTIIQLHKKI